MRRNRKRVRCLVEVGPGFTGVTPAAAWEDVKLGLRTMRALDGCAVLTDDDRICGASRVGAFLLPCPVRLFALGERSDAVAWLTSLPAAAAIRPRLVQPGVVVVEVIEPLRTEDFVVLAEIVDGWLGRPCHAAGTGRAHASGPGLGDAGQPAAPCRLRARPPSPDRAGGGGQRCPWAALLPHIAGRVLHPQARAFGRIVAEHTSIECLDGAAIIRTITIDLCHALLLCSDDAGAARRRHDAAAGAPPGIGPFTNPSRSARIRCC